MAATRNKRKPIHIATSQRFPEGRQVIWAAIRKLRGFTVFDIERETRINEHTIRTYVMGLERGGYLERHNPTRAKGQYQKARWTLVNDVGVDAPRVTRDGKPVTQGTRREQMWRTMRILGEFTIPDLAINASTEEHPVNEGDVKHYCMYLARAGYLTVVTPGKPGNRPGTGTRQRYRMLKSRYTGPQPPMIQRVHQVFDPNLGVVVWPKDGAA